MGAGAVDPDLLRARVGAVRPEALRLALSAVVETGLRCRGRVDGLDFASLEVRAAEHASEVLWGSIAPSLEALWDLLRTVEGSLEALRAVGDPSWRRRWDGVSASWFLLIVELDEMQERLATLVGVPEGWELVGALQGHVEKVRFVLDAVLAEIFALLPPKPGEWGGLPRRSELVRAQERRTRLQALRDVALACEDEMGCLPPSRWLASLQRISDALGVFVFGPGYAALRASEKYALVAQQRLLREVLLLWSPLRATAARQAVEALARYIEALEVVNQHESLRARDRDLLTQVVLHMDRAAVRDEQAPKEIAAALAALAEARGCDRELDALVEQTLSPGSAVPIARILKRAREVLAELAI